MINKFFFQGLVITLILIIMSGCATVEYYGFLEPQRSANEQFMDIPYVYSGLVTTKKGNGNKHSPKLWYEYQFSGVLFDRNNKYLDISIPSNISIKEHSMVSEILDAKLRKNKVTLSNSNKMKDAGDPVLLVINPYYPFRYDDIKAHPEVFFKQYYIHSQTLPQQTDSTCPRILFLNIDVYEEHPTTMEMSDCPNGQKGNASESIAWEKISQWKIRNQVEHQKPFGYQVGYLGFLITLPVDIVITPLYTIGWGVIASVNLL